MSNVTAATASFSTVGQGWIAFRSLSVQQAALAQAKGCYQRNLLEGWEAWSGSTLKGKASRYGARYAGSRTSLITRLRAAGIPVAFETRGQRKVAVVG